MAQAKLKWSTGNEKLVKLKTVSFNLPAFRSQDGFAVCPMAGACATVCYARQGRYIMPTVAASREANLLRVRGDLKAFMYDAIQDLDGPLKKFKTVRVHDSGDFFSQDYLEAWFGIARAFPGRKFYAYTKSIHLSMENKPKNFQIIQSVGGLLDKQIDKSKSHSMIFASHADRRKAGYVNGNTNDAPAIRGEQKIGLVYHGTRKLKKGQERWLKSSR